MRRIFPLFITLLLITSAVFAAGGGETAEEVTVLTSTDIIADVVRNIAGDSINVESIIPTGFNPHAFEPGPRDIARIEDAPLVILNGLGLEEGLEEVVENVDGARILELDEGIEILAGGHDDHDDDHDDHDDDHDDHDDDHDKDHDDHDEDHDDHDEDHDDHDEDHDDHDEDHDDHDEDHDDHDEDHDDHDDHDEDHDDHDDHDHSAGDPHFWVSPRNVMIWVETIADELIEVFPELADEIAENAEAYIAELEILDAEISSSLAAIPAEQRILISDHSTMGYFARDYGFEVTESLVGYSDIEEPSATDIREIVELIDEVGVSAVFISNTAPESLRDLLNVVSEETGVEVVVLLTGSLAPAGEPGDNYLDFIAVNVENIINGLGN